MVQSPVMNRRELFFSSAKGKRSEKHCSIRTRQIQVFAK